ncbi:hypothetical protein L7F22_041278 [Adiantum nelumboides]|nr:hypothetical protein [Adiantum nelumboides]
MAVQEKAWMIGELFQAWLQHFDNSIMIDIGKESRHFLILDGHGSHISLEVVAKAHASGIDIITLPTHTSHKLQAFDVSVFKSLKVQFRKERDIWQQRAAPRQASKFELASIVAKAITSSFIEANIKAWFQARGIWPLNPSAVKFEGMPCNHINIVGETTSINDEDISQVPATPVNATIEDEAIHVLNNMVAQQQEEEPLSSQQNGTIHKITFTNLMEADISNYSDILATPHVCKNSSQGDTTLNLADTVLCEQPNRSHKKSNCFRKSPR